MDPTFIARKVVLKKVLSFKINLNFIEKSFSSEARLVTAFQSSTRSAIFATTVMGLEPALSEQLNINPSLNQFNQ